MKSPVLPTLLLVLATGGPGLAQPSSGAGYMTSAQRAELLKGSAAVEARTLTTVDATDGLPAAEVAKKVAVDDVLRDLEARTGAESGAVVFRASGARGYLSFDPAKTRRSPLLASRLPFAGSAGGAPEGIKSVDIGTSVEFRSETTRAGADQVVAIKSGDTLAARAHKTGDAPVTVEIKSASLVARQVPGATPRLAVSVTVGGQTQVLAVGDVREIGKYEVEIERSANLSNRPPEEIEGPVYGLALRVRPVSTDK